MGLSQRKASGTNPDPTHTFVEIIIFFLWLVQDKSCQLLAKDWISLESVGQPWTCFSQIVLSFSGSARLFKLWSLHASHEWPCWQVSWWGEDAEGISTTWSHRFLGGRWSFNPIALSHLMDKSEVSCYYSKCSKISNTNCLPKRPRQKGQSQIRLLPKKQSDQGLSFLLLWQEICEFKPWKPTFYLEQKKKSVRNFRTFTVGHAVLHCTFWWDPLLWSLIWVPRWKSWCNITVIMP